MSRRPFRPTVRLRARVTLGFAIGSLLLAILLVLITYGLTREAIVRQREDASTEQFFRNAGQVQAQLQSESPDFNVILASLPSVAGSRNIVRTDERWLTPSALTQQSLPEGLVAAVLRSEEPQRMRYTQAGQPVLGIGLQLRPTEVSAFEEIAYFEVVPFGEVEDTLQSLATILVIAAAVTVLLGASLGVWAGGRVLQPLAGISDAARSIAAGRFDTRVERVDDPDLRPIVEAFNDMASAMQQRIARDARFASDVSHELRSPLMTLRASLGVMEARREELSERSRQALDLLADDVERFERMVQDLLEISRADSASIESSPVNVSELVRNAIAERPEPINLTVADDADGVIVMGDKRRLAQALTNLLTNAEKYAGGATDVHLDVENGFVRIAVEDEGPGVTPAERELIFERFARGAAARRRGNDDGAGLGLALVDEHMRRHGGSVGVESRPDGEAGARFVIEIPRTRT